MPPKKDTKGGGKDKGGKAGGKGAKAAGGSDDKGEKFMKKQIAGLF